MTQEMILNLAKVINTLNHIDVRGKENLAALVGSIGVLEDIYAKIMAPPEEEKDMVKKETEAS